MKTPKINSTHWKHTCYLTHFSYKQMKLWLKWTIPCRTLMSMISALLVLLLYSGWMSSLWGLAYCAVPSNVFTLLLPATIIIWSALKKTTHSYFRSWSPTHTAQIFTNYSHILCCIILNSHFCTLLSCHLAYICIYDIQCIGLSFTESIMTCLSVGEQRLPVSWHVWGRPHYISLSSCVTCTQIGCCAEVNWLVSRCWFTSKWLPYCVSLFFYKSIKESCQLFQHPSPEL